MKYALLATVFLVGVTHTALPPASRTALQYNQVEYSSPVVECRIAEAELQLAIANVDIDKAKNQLEDAKDNYDRDAVLIKQKAISSEQFDTTTLAYRQAQCDLTRAKLSKTLAEKQIDTLRALLKVSKEHESIN